MGEGGDGFPCEEGRRQVGVPRSREPPLPKTPGGHGEANRELCGRHAEWGTVSLEAEATRGSPCSQTSPWLHLEAQPGSYAFLFTQGVPAALVVSIPRGTDTPGLVGVRRCDVTCAVESGPELVLRR